MKKHFIVVDTETTMQGTAADFGAAIVNLKGEIVDRIGVMIAGEFDQKELWFDRKAPDSAFWSARSCKTRREAYNLMLRNGSRVMATQNAVNQWLTNAAIKYRPELTAYNLKFDLEVCEKTGINLNIFPERFCLWHAAAGNLCHKKDYRRFVLEHHLFNAPTDSGNMSYQTNAEAVASWIAGSYDKEPHTALEDVEEWEIPILLKIIKIKGWREKTIPYNWRNFQVRDWFIPK